MTDPPPGVERAAAGVELARWWWLFCVRGAAGLLFGLAALVWPTMTAGALVILFAAWAMLDGGASLVAALRGGRRGRRGREAFVVALEGLVGVAAGAVALAWPQPTLIVLALLAGAWAIVTGVLQIVGALRLRRAVRGEWLLAAAGLASLLAGIVLVRLPVAGIVGLTLVLAAYAVASGAALIGLGVRLWRVESGAARASTA